MLLRKNERGAALVEFAIGALVFFIAVFGVLECGRLLWTHNALADAVRRGARYAVIHAKNMDKVKNVVVYGNPAGDGQSVVNGLAPSNVTVTYSNPFGAKIGNVSVKITGYNFNFALPLIGSTLAM